MGVHTLCWLIKPCIRLDGIDFKKQSVLLQIHESKEEGYKGVDEAAAKGIFCGIWG